MADQNLEISEKLFKIITLQNDIHTKNESVLFDNVKKLGEQVDDDIELIEGKKIKIEDEEDSIKISVKDNDVFCIINSNNTVFTGESRININGEVLKTCFDYNDQGIKLDSNLSYNFDAQIEFIGKTENPSITVSVPVFGNIEKTYKINTFGDVLNITGIISNAEEFYINVKSKTKITAKIKYLQIVEL